MCDDTFMLKWKFEGRGEGKRSGKSAFHNGWKKKSKDFYAASSSPCETLFSVYHFSIFLKVTSVVIVKWKSFGAKELKNSENKIFKKV